MDKANSINIIKLTKEYLKSAINLVNAVFDEEDEYPKAEIKASINEQWFNEYKSKYDNNLISTEYFIVTNEKQKVKGIIGIYELEGDYQDTMWIGWFCVHKKYRGRGIGVALLNYSIEVAKERGKRYFSLYTSTDKNEADAQVLYELNGFYITKRIYKKGYEILFRRKDLYK